MSLTLLVLRATALLAIPSAIVPIDDIPDLNILINPRHPEIAGLKIVQRMLFSLDTRLFA